MMHVAVCARAELCSSCTSALECVLQSLSYIISSDHLSVEAITACRDNIVVQSRPYGEANSKRGAQSAAVMFPRHRDMGVLVRRGGDFYSL